MPPPNATPEEIGEFWDAHSLADYWDETHEVEFHVNLKSQQKRKRMKDIMCFGDFVDVNPRIQLEKGKEYPYVEMADVTPSNGFISPNLIFSNRKLCQTRDFLLPKFTSGEIDVSELDIDVDPKSN